MADLTIDFCGFGLKNPGSYGFLGELFTREDIDRLLDKIEVRFLDI